MPMPVQPNAQTALEPAAYVESFVEIDGLRLHVQDYGTSGKPPMLCVHGGGANAHWFDFVAQGFNADYHVRAVDLRGHGDSEWDNSNPPNYDYTRHAADIHELTEKLDLRDFVLVGHSMGGMVSIVYAATYPGRAKALIVVDSNLVVSPERIAGFQAVADRPAREYATPGGVHRELPSPSRRQHGSSRSAASCRATQRTPVRRRPLAPQGRPQGVCESRARG